MGWRWALTATALIVLSAASLRAQLTAETIVRGLRNPVAIAAIPGEPEAFLIVEQQGLVRMASNGILVADPFLDLRSEISSGGERGLLGIAFAPDFADSRRFFVYFTNRSGDLVISRFRTDVERRETAEAGSRFDLMWPDGRRFIPHPTFSNHNGGHLAFGPDGYLYIGVGDGGSGGDPMNHAQNPQILLGKMLRVDVSVPDEDPRGYRVPEDNPFVDGEPIRALHEIWAFGLRNPWRYTFDDWTRGGTSALLIGDVGQNAREEINFEPAGRGGRNYGWRIREGRQSFEPRTTAAFEPLTEPIHDYGRAFGASVTGGFVYRGSGLDPSYNGRYFYADFISGRVFSIGLHLSDTGEASADDEREHTASLGGSPVIGMVSSFGVDHDGELLLLNYAGTVVRIVPDFAVVPQAPQLVARTGGSRVRLEWQTSQTGVVAEAFTVERLRNGAVVERLATERFDADLEWVAGECFRVRGLGRQGAGGPPSAAVCAPRTPASP